MKAKWLVALLLFSTSGLVRAEGGCPSGMIPYRGTDTSSCGPIPSGYYGNSNDEGYAPPLPPPPDLYAAYSADPEHGKLFWTTFYRSADDAVTGALQACNKATGQACKSLGWFSNQCGALALTQDRRIFSGHDKNWRNAAQKAMKACGIEGPTSSVCRLWVPPVCTGAQFSANANDEAVAASDAEIEALSAKLDKREYWGVVAASDTGEVETRVNMPSRKSAERAVTGDSVCKGCTVRFTYKNSCAGLAWPSDGRPVLEALLNDDPQKAESDARGRCALKYGDCVGVARCSGRRYRDGYPSGSPKLQKNGTWADAS